jgi:hypothetical protein
MDIYLAGDSYNKDIILRRKIIPLFRLNSFYYMPKWEIELIKKRVFKKYMLDSGAFTFVHNHKKSVSWDEYLEKYAEFIVENKIDLFIELDIEAIVGMNSVEKFRTKLENLTKKKSIPVWHKKRGKQYFIDMAKEYNYISIAASGLGDSAWLRKTPNLLTWFINTSHEYNAKIHGLGFTPLNNMKKYRFDSVDSKSWLVGARGRYLNIMRESYMDKINLPKEKRIKPREVALHNFKEWVKFQKYAEENL